MKKKLKKILFWRSIFVDKNGTYTGFTWWWEWTKAYHSWYRWLRYEGMPAEIKDVDEMHAWNRRLIRKQDEIVRKARRNEIPNP